MTTASTTTTTTTSRINDTRVPNWKASGDWFMFANATYHVLVSLRRLQLLKTAMAFWLGISKKETKVIFRLMA
jgi:hypothetical protein